MTRGWALFWGLVLVLIGGLALLFNLGLLQPEELTRVAALWPLLLILVGLQIVLARLLPRNTAAISLSLLALVLVAGSVGYVVSAPPAVQKHRSFTIAREGGGPATLRVELGAANITIEAGSVPGALAAGRIDYRGGIGRAPAISWQSGPRTLEISHSDSGGLLFAPNSPDRLRLTLDSETSWIVQLDTGASTTTLRFGSLNLRRLAINGGADTVDLALGSPSGRVAVEIEGGANRVSISRPAATAMHVDVNGGANSFSVDGQSQGGVIGEAGWSSARYPAADAFDITVDGGANRVTVTTSG